jgi:hypothetical protein
LKQKQKILQFWNIERSKQNEKEIKEEEAK